MMWYQSLTAKLEGKQIVNDSKTPSGTVHVGSLRGVLIHDALYRALQQPEHAGTIDATFTYGIDDYDPMDGLPVDAGEDLLQHMGKPLCHVPAPAGSNATDMADHYTQEFLEIFTELAVEANIYRTRDLYRDGVFNTAIETILDQAALVREIYLQVSGSKKPDHWYPFQIICESCGKIGSTQVTDYRDGLVSYQCLPDLVTWAQGCGHKGQVSPFNGAGKLPWKLEWVAKWATLGITIEGAGKDHCTKGGSHDVAVRCLQRIFHKQPPLNVPYEFFLVSGAKMSSSKGVGASARSMADFLPPAVLRFLMIRTPPKRTVNFSTDLQYIVKLFNEYDQLLAKSPQDSEDVAGMQAMVQSGKEPLPKQPVGFQLISALLQLPHIDVMAELTSRYDLNDQQTIDLQARIAAAEYWLQHYASDDDKVTLQQEMPEAANQLSASQKVVLYLLATSLPEEKVSDDVCQQLIFDCARLVPMNSKAAFSALYCVLLDKQQGPKGGSLLAYIDQQFLRQRLTALQPDVAALLEETTITPDDFLQLVDGLSITSISHRIIASANPLMQCVLQIEDGRTQMVRTQSHTSVQQWIQAQGNSKEYPDIENLDWQASWQQLTGRDIPAS